MRPGTTLKHMTHEWQERLLKADINISNSGDNVVITPGSGEMPAAWDNPGTYIAIDQINLIPNAAVTMTFKNGATTDANNGTVPQASYGGPYSLAQNQGFVIDNPMQHQDGIVTLKPNKSFVINLGSGVQVSGFVRYRLMQAN